MDHGVARALSKKKAASGQLGLFELSPGPIAVTDDQRRKAGKKLVEKLLTIRRGLDEIQEQEFYSHLDALIQVIRACSELTDSQREELILHSIEVQGACTPVEMAEDTRLLKPTVMRLLKGLENRGEVYKVRRLVPGSDRPQFIYKSKRAGVPEVTDQLIRQPASTAAMWEDAFL
jgi:hypothetical protein